MEIHPQIYHKLIDPLMESTRSRVRNCLTSENKLLDIACGTGELVLSLANQCKEVTGIDLDDSMINFAIRRKNRLGFDNADFRKMDATRLETFPDKSFTHSNMTLALHQFRPQETEIILKEALRVAPELILTDYSYPLPGGFKKPLLHFIERVAGKEHYQNFRSFLERKGVPGIIAETSYHIFQEEVSGSAVFTFYRIRI